LARHVRLHEEDLRTRLVGHEGRKRLAITLDGVPRDAADWQDAVEAWHRRLSGEIAGAEWFACDFTTSTEADRVAAQIVMMDAYAPYFAYWAVSVCGIPSITLTGTVVDWQRIRDRVEFVRGFGLDAWCRSLEPILDQFVRAAAGNVDTGFWRRVYNPVDAYGGEVVTGWAARFYPYLTSADSRDYPNPLLDLPIDEPRGITAARGDFYNGPGIGTDGVPATLSRVRVTLEDQTSGRTQTVELHAGLIGVVHGPEGALCPTAGWYASEAGPAMSEVIDRIVADHEVWPLAEGDEQTGPAELIALYARIGSARLFGGTWSVRGPADQRFVDGLGEQLGDGLAATFLDLPDGRSLGYHVTFASEAVRWFAARTAPASWNHTLTDDPPDVRVYGTSLALILQTALDNDGDFEELATGTLADLADLLTRQARTGAEPAA
ncbi:MAG: DUF4419 domain-containing protein, partial [Catenulispora sp.]|nr:DUF4419 domain-containing protein [Catenulispora sp.]